MKIRLMTIFSILGVLLIFLAQTYIVYSNFNQTRDFLTRETNAVIEEAFKSELDMRQQSRVRGSKLEVIPPARTEKNNTVFNLDKTGKGSKKVENNSIDNHDVIGLINTATHLYVSKSVPLDIQRLDSITSTILEKRNIHSDFVVRKVQPVSEEVLQSSKETFSASRFLIKSNYLALDFEEKESLQLVLINPLGSIFKRIGTLLISSFLLSLFCFYGLWFLFRTLNRQKKLMEVKNDFFGNTAHELKRPVAQLHMAIEALMKPTIYEHPAKRDRYLSISRDATKDMAEKINMIMTLSMAEEGVFKLNYSHFNLLEEVQKLKEQFQTVTDKKVNIHIEKTSEDFQINADRDHIRQCLANLLDNAVKYSGDSVLISIHLQRLKDSLNISVKDNGIGIEAVKLKSVFEKYTRLNNENGSPSGFGIGLNYVKTVIEKHAGSVEVKSEKGKGSEFILCMPA